MFLISTDQIGHRVALPSIPQRIVSLVPSQTELLFDLGVGDRVVGRTRFCIHPKVALKQVKSVGGTKDFTLARVAALAPDLIIANKEENVKEGIEELQKHFRVWTSDINTLDQAYHMITEVGRLVHAETRARQLVTDIQAKFTAIGTASAPKKRVLYLIWRNPFMAAGQDTFISHIMAQAGWQNAVSAARYPVLAPEQIADLAPDCIFLSSEPYPFKAQHIVELQFVVPHARICLVDGELFSWYGSRLQYTPAYLAELFTETVGG